MILGMSLPAFTLLHVLISLLAIATGLVVVVGMGANRTLPGWTAVFIQTTALTSITGFFFPFVKLGPPHIFAIVSLLLLVPCVIGLYGRRVVGGWRPIYVITAVILLYLNVVVLVVQSFQKIAFLNAFAPKGNEPVVGIVQGVVLVAFIVLGVMAVRGFRPGRR
jgi:hypothetical protein